MPPTGPHARKTPPGGYPTCEGCALMQKVMDTVYGDCLEDTPGIVKTVNEILKTMQAVEASFRSTKAILKWLGLGSLPAAYGVYMILKQLFK